MPQSRIICDLIASSYASFAFFKFFFFKNKYTFQILKAARHSLAALLEEVDLLMRKKDEGGKTFGVT